MSPRKPKEWFSRENLPANDTCRIHPKYYSTEIISCGMQKLASAIGFKSRVVGQFEKPVQTLAISVPGRRLSDPRSTENLAAVFALLGRTLDRFSTRWARHLIPFYNYGYAHSP